MHDAPKRPKEDQSIKVLLADKGRASVVIDADKPSYEKAVGETVNLEMKRTSIGDRLQQDQVTTQTAAWNLRFTECY